MDTSDFQAGDDFRLAGLTQASTGQRVIENKIIEGQAQNENSARYWIDRANYYKGRNEEESELQTYKLALARFPCANNTADAATNRVYIWMEFSQTNKEEEIREQLRSDFKQCRANGPYLVCLARRIYDDYDDVFDDLFVNTDLLSQLLSGQPKWRDDEKYLIEDVTESKSWEPKKLEATWNQLSLLAFRDVNNRAYSLATAMTENNEYRRAIPLLEASRKYAREQYYDDLMYDRKDVEAALFDAYLTVGDWRKAEKMYVGGYREGGDELVQLAVAAAKNRDIADAIRLWKMNVNLDRRQLSGIDQLAKTDAKTQLRDLYLKMKTQDMLTSAPEKALGYLN